MPLTTRLWRLATLAWALGAAACLTAPPPHPRAQECKDLCSRYIAEGDLTKAEVQCDLGLQFAPTFADLWVNKGLIALRREQVDKAKDCFIKALRYNNEQAQGYNNLGFIYYREKAYGKAHDHFQRALKVNPDYVEARFNLGLTYKGFADDYAQSGKLEKAKDYRALAKKEFRTINAVNPSLADPFARLGEIEIAEGEFEEAVRNLSRAVELARDFADAWLLLGNAHMELGRFRDAAEDYKSCIEADEKKIECRQNLVIANRKAGLSDKSLQDIKENATAEKSPEKEYQLAREYRERGLRNEEERSYKRCVKNNPRFAPCHWGLFEIFSDDRRDKDATTACKNFIKYADSAEFPKEVEACEKFLSRG